MTSTTRPSILLVDDEPLILRSLLRVLRTEGCELHTCTSGSEALDFLERTTVDLVISDQKMPRMTGLEFLKEVRRRFPSVIRIMLTGQGDMDTAIAAINQNEIARFLTKPWDDDELRVAVRTALIRHGAHEDETPEAEAAEVG